MPKWEPPPVAVTDMPAGLEDVSSAAGLAVAPLIPRPLRSKRRVADPFDATDDGTNCIGCGYAIEPARAKRGLMTCAGCG
jgi:hypothetical protein